MKMTISEIAKLANVSKSSVSLVLNNKSGVSSDTRAKVLGIIKKYHYRPNQIAQSLAGRGTKSIGLVIKEIDNPYFARLMRGVYDACAGLEYSVLLGSSQLSVEKESEIIKTMVSKRVDGLIISPLQSEESDFSYLGELSRDGYPLVLLGGVTNFATNTVDIDNYQAAYDAVKFLIEKGHRHIAHLMGLPYSRHGQQRLQGYQQALIDHDLPVQKPFIVPGEPYLPNGYQAGKRMFMGPHPLPTAVFCYNDLVAIGLMNALHELGYDVPGQVSVMGFDNIDIDEYLRIPLTTVQMPAYNIGTSAAHLLVRQIGSKGRPRLEHSVLEHKIVERKSVTERSEAVSVGVAAKA